MIPAIALLADAWQQLRIHRARVLLSLVGVGVAIACLTASFALGTVVEQVTTAQYESQTGRPATIQFQLSPENGEQPDAAAAQAAFDAIVARYRIGYASGNTSTSTTVQTPSGPQQLNLNLVSEDYAVIHRVSIDEGRWLVSEDAERLAPAVVVNQPLLDLLGLTSIAGHPTLELPAGRHAVIVGVANPPSMAWGPAVFALTSADVLADDTSWTTPTFEVWVPLADADDAQRMISRDLRAALPGITVYDQRTDYLAWQEPGQDPLLSLKILTIGASGAILLLGMLSLVNIAVVTVRQRVREIGIRRAFGASRTRVFLGIVLESVVGTAAAGLIGIVVVVLGYRMPFLADSMQMRLADMPPFPVEAALGGLLVAVAVGALAGIVPAIVAVRSKVIDAIRF